MFQTCFVTFTTVHLTGLFCFFFMVLEAKEEYRILHGYVIGEPYDYGSVMHYGYNFFSVDSKRPVIVKLMPGGKQIGQRDGFSDLDLRKINKLYNCTKYISECSLPALVRDFFSNLYASPIVLDCFYRIDKEAQTGHSQNSFRYEKCNGYKKCIYCKLLPWPSGFSLSSSTHTSLSLYDLVLARDFLSCLV